MVRRSCPVASVALIKRLYRAMVATLSGLTEALQAFICVPHHMRCAGTPDHLLLELLTVLFLTGYFTALQAEPGTPWSGLCITIADGLRATCDPLLL